ncbi:MULTISPECIES: hypothetical protein [Cyanophyceae]|nr:hypothetical protein [Trichocoleus sp. FACHB-40]MBD2002537.1 hypothetical protein [Trichocoleus sp. FACHB-40]
MSLLWEWQPTRLRKRVIDTPLLAIMSGGQFPVEKPDESARIGSAVKT